jgi:rSAM/selenodomain-associated transferase 1
MKRNILDDEGDYERYKHDIPVILVNDREIARHHMTEAELETALDLADLAIVIMTKLPEPGRVKTRLMPVLSARQAAEVHRAFLLHLAGRIGETPAELIICHDPPDCIGPMNELVGREAAAGYWPQCEGDLGARLAAASDATIRHTKYVMFLGTDSPDVPFAFIARITHLLRSHDLVIAPADDGGFWAVALTGRVDAPKLFAQIEWSTGRECGQTLERARGLGYNVALADRWDDVDRPDDLRRLIERLRRSHEPHDQALLQRLSRIVPDGVAP